MHYRPPMSTRIAAAAALGWLSGWSSMAAATHGAAIADTESVPGVWQHHQVKFTYTGLSTLYSCEGLEMNVRSVLLHFGARKDLNVTASGCVHGPDRASRSAFIDTDYYSLSTADSKATDTVKGYWSAVAISPRHPSFLDFGDCELMEQMKDLIVRTFTLQDLDYRADCFAHDINDHAFLVKGWAFKAMAEQKIAPVKY
jgi:hypothetical protein